MLSRTVRSLLRSSSFARRRGRRLAFEALEDRRLLATLQVGPGQTYQTINAAMTAAASGDTLLIHDGIYLESLLVNKSLTFQGVNVGGAVIDGGGSVAVFDVRANSNYRGLFLRNAGNGITIRGEVNAQVHAERIIASNVGVAFSVGQGAARIGRMVVDNSVVLDSDQAANINDGDTIQITNSILDNVSTAYVTWNANAIIPSHNLLHNVTNVAIGSGIQADPAQLVGDPLFVDRAGGDYRLQPGSPAIDSGVDVGLPYLGTAPDRGAFESEPNLPPTDIGLSATSVAENQPFGTAVGTFTTTDPDLPNDSHTYALVAGPGATDNGAFTIDGDQLKTNAAFNFEVQSSYAIRVQTTDAGGLTWAEPLNIEVTDVADTATLSIDDVQILEGDSGTRTLTFTVTSGGDVDTAFTVDWATQEETATAAGYVLGRTFSVDISDPRVAFAGNLDGDADPDFVVWNGSQLRIHEDTGTSTLATRYSLAGSMRGCAVADVDRNGVNEVLIGDSWGSARIIEASGNDTYSNVFDVSGLSIMDGDPAVGDTDNDGWDEWLISSEGVPMDVARVEGRAGGGFSQLSSLSLAGIGDGNNWVSGAADFDSDGTADIVVSDRDETYVGGSVNQIFRPSLGGATIGDTDGDGRLEIISPLAVYEWTGSGFSAIHDRGGRVGDLDGDGRDELLYTGPVSVGENSGSEFAVVWSSAELPAFAPDGLSVDFLSLTAAADLDADGVGDIAAAQGSSLYVFTSAGAGNRGDYVSASGTLTFAGRAGETQTIGITILGDEIVELDETFLVSLSNVQDSGRDVTIGDGAGRGKIVNDDSAFALQATEAEKPEGHVGPTAFTFTVTRTGYTGATAALSFTVQGSGPNSADGGDFVGGLFPTGAVNFGVGDTSQVLTIQVNGDQLVEPDEGFTVTVAGAGSAAGLIVNDESDLGDAPAPYPTLIDEDGARHRLVPGGPRLGAAVDADLEGQPSPTALGDDAAGATPDDEDGVIFDAVRVGQAEGVVTVNVQNGPGGAKLDAWVDFDNDGSWSAAEQIATDLAVGNGDTTIVYALPSSVTFGARYARFRLSTAGGLQPTGAAMTGEVEDHVVNIRDAFAVVLPATGTSNDVTVRLNGSHLEVFDNIGQVALFSQPLAFVNSLSVGGVDGKDDRVTVDYDFGGFFELPGGLQISGGAGASDALVVRGDGQTMGFYASQGGWGQATVETVSGEQRTAIAFSGVEPLTIEHFATFAFDVQGPLAVGSQTLTLDVTTFTALDLLTTLAGGTITAGGGLALGSGESLFGRGTIDGRMAASFGSTIVATGDLVLGDSNSYAGFSGDGELYVGANTLTLRDRNEARLGTLTSLGNGTSAGTLVAANSAVVDFGKNVTGYGTVDTPNSVSKPLINNGDILGNSSSQPLTLTGYVKGVGNFDNVHFSGTYSPGLSPIQQQVGSVDILDSATLVMELGGSEPGTQYDQVVASGTVNLDGTLEVSLLNGFVPTVGDRFELITAAGGVSGTFATETLPGLPTGLRWNVMYHPNDVTLLVLPLTLVVIELTPTRSGFVAQFSDALQPAGLNLYDGAEGTLGAADVVLKDGSGQTVTGSMVVADDRQTIEFVQTGEVLTPGTYTVTLKSGVNAFRRLDDGLLDGNRDGTAGDDFTTSFTLAESSDRVVSIPDMARGAGQGMNIPNTASGLPIRISDATGVRSVAVDLVHNQDLLNITAAALAPSLPADWSVVLDPATVGVAKIRASGTTPLSGTNVEVVRLTAAVPGDAAYGAVQAVRLLNVVVNGGVIATIGDVAVHKAVYLGDADGSGIHSSADAFLTVQAALGLASGFAAHAWTDPLIVGDADGSGVLSAADAFLIVQEGLSLSEPFVPDNPHITVAPVGGGIDPQFRIDVNLPAYAGGPVTVPVKLDIEPAATNVGAIEFELFFDPAQLTIQLPGGVSVGADTAGWAVSAVLVAPGQLRVGMVSSSAQPLVPGLREIARVQFQVEASAGSAAFRRLGDDRLKPALRTPVSERPGNVAGLDIEPVDAGAGGYTWTDADGSVLIRPAARALAGARRERVWDDLDAKADLLESVFEDLTHEIVSVYR